MASEYGTAREKITEELLPVNGSNGNTDASGGCVSSKYADQLATWVEKMLVNRTDAWGSYNRTGQITRRGKLLHSHLARHFQARSPLDIIGLHTADNENLSRGGALDIDQHGDDPERAKRNLTAALSWYRFLTLLGFHPLLTSSNGAGGYHLRILLAEPIDARRVHRFLRWLTSDHERYGLEKPPEQFPKQADVRKCCKRLGNWIRIPGRHHKRDYWSRIWDGSRWLKFRDGVDFILSLPGDPRWLVPPDEREVAPAIKRRTRVNPVTDDDLINRRIEKYMLCLPNASEGEGRDDIAYRFAAFLVRDMGRADDAAADWLDLWDTGNRPPKGRKRLLEIIRNARSYGQRPMGCGLNGIAS